MNINEEIYKVLSLAGEDGLSVKKISLHVCNAYNDLFRSTSYEDIHGYVVKFLRRNSSRKHSAIEKGGKRGYYRLRQEPYDLFSALNHDCAETNVKTDTDFKGQKIDAPFLFQETEIKE